MLVKAGIVLVARAFVLIFAVLATTVAALFLAMGAFAARQSLFGTTTAVPPGSALVLLGGVLTAVTALGAVFVPLILIIDTRLRITIPLLAGATLVIAAIFGALHPLLVSPAALAAILPLCIWCRRQFPVDPVFQPGLCRNCGYDLRGLAVPRCPECGASTPRSDQGRSPA